MSENKPLVPYVYQPRPASEAPNIYSIGLPGNFATTKERAQMAVDALNGVVSANYRALAEQLAAALKRARQRLPQSDSLPFVTRTEIGDIVSEVDTALAAAKERGIE